MALEEVDSKRRWAILDQSVDASQNTPLHIAVQAGFADIVRVLLDAGANPQLRNVYGDTPSQWRMWPRLGAAARLCWRRMPLRIED